MKPPTELITCHPKERIRKEKLLPVTQNLIKLLTQNNNNNNKTETQSLQL